MNWSELKAKFKLNLKLKTLLAVIVIQAVLLLTFSYVIFQTVISVISTSTPTSLSADLIPKTT